MKLLFSDQPIEVADSDTVIFLAGPTSRTNKYNESWRKEAVEILDKLGFDGVVCIPEFSTARNFEPTDWDRQTDWEWALLDRADCIVFWVPRDDIKLPGLTTNLEFGTYLEREPEKIALGYPPEATHMQWMRKRYALKNGGNVYYILEGVLRAGKSIAEHNAFSRRLALATEESRDH